MRSIDFQFGIDPNLANKEGQTTLMIAKSIDKNKDKMTELLSQAIKVKKKQQEDSVFKKQESAFSQQELKEIGNKSSNSFFGFNEEFSILEKQQQIQVVSINSNLKLPMPGSKQQQIQAGLINFNSELPMVQQILLMAAARAALVKKNLNLQANQNL